MRWVPVVMAGTLLVAGCSDPLRDEAGTGAAAGTDATPVAFEVRAGGPYQADADGTVRLVADVALEGQSTVDADLRRIGEALDAYHADHGTYPPAALTDDTGRPLLSWRVLLLPYLGEADLADQFDLSVAWDAPANLALLDQMPDVYRGGRAEGGTETGIAGAAGRKSVFGRSGPALDSGVAASAVTDGVTMTIAAGPVGDGVHVPWTAPGDIDASVDQALGSPVGFDGVGEVGTPLLFLDGSVRTMPDDLAAEVLHSWATIASGGCSPPVGQQIQYRVEWDLDGDGTFDVSGTTAELTDVSSARQVTVRVTDALGGVHTTTAEVTA
jgi:hypothetical protein